MAGTSPKLWPYSVNTSPLPLPSQAILYTPGAVIDLQFTNTLTSLSPTLSGETLQAYIAQYRSGTSTLEELLLAHNAAPLAERRPILLQGELANPYRLQDIGMPALPLLPVRLEGLCRTWADGLDPRDTYPGIHHVTLARTPGWWEMSVIGFATKEQLKLIREWLENGVSNSWRPVKLAEGTIRFEHAILEPPSAQDVDWDGTMERVTRPMPEASGPALDLDALLVVVHTRQGCYNHRGRIARCVHMQQRAFHDNLFRKGSSHRWDAILSVR